MNRIHNEGKTIYQLLEKIASLNLNNEIQKDIIVVNDCSLDNSKEEIERFIKQNINIQFIENKVNLGKGGIH